MSVWDYVMPHRFLINKSLRKGAEDLRARLDDYQLEYNRRLEECQEDSKRIEEIYQEKYNKVKKSLEEELQNEKSILESVSQDIAVYVDEYLHRNCLFQMRDIKRKQIEILKEDSSFLRGQMELVSREVDYFREMQNELTSFTNVKDIIRLISLSGYEINFVENDNAQDLIDKVSQAIKNFESGQDTEKFALVRLKGIIQERSEYLPIIKYIAWVIQQKINFRVQLSNKRRIVKDTQKDIWQEINKLETNIKSITKILDETARRIRYYWARPITYLNADISYAYNEKSVIASKLIELRGMKCRYYYDQDMRDKLYIERIKLLQKKNSLDMSILSNKKERKKWFEKCNYIFQLCKKCEVSLMCEKKTKTDEDCIIANRLVELTEIRAVGIDEAKKKCEQEKLEITSRYNEKHGELELEMFSSEKIIRQLELEYDVTMNKVLLEEKELNHIKNIDNRFFLLKILFETPELNSTRKRLLSLKKELTIINNTKFETEEIVSKIKYKIAKLEKNYEHDLIKCVPRILRPTDAEIKEEKKLVYRKEEIEKRRKVGGYENKS